MPLVHNIVLFAFSSHNAINLPINPYLQPSMLYKFLVQGKHRCDDVLPLVMSVDHRAEK